MKFPTRKLLLGALVLALAAGGAFAAFAQEEESTATSACDWRPRGAGYHIPLDALTELDMTIGELRDHLMSGGSIEELLDVSELRAEWQANRLACIDELEANGDLTAEQAAALRAVIETGAREAMREAIGGRDRGKGDHFGWSRRGGHGIEMRRSFGRRGMPSMPMIPDIFRGLPFGDLDELFEELEASGSLDEAMRERLEQLEEALRSGGRGFFGFRIDRDEDGKWHFDWFDEDDAETDADLSDDSGETPSEESEESEDTDDSANHSA